MRANLVIAALLAILFAATTSAEARRHQDRSAAWAGFGYMSDSSYNSDAEYTGERRQKRQHRRHRQIDSESGGYSTASRAPSGGYGVGARPGKWCGWYMRTQLGGGPEFNLAANWRRYGSSTTPQVGAVVVWPHHVGIITGQASNGQWIVKSGNDSGRVRERARSVSGAVFRI